MANFKWYFNRLAAMSPSEVFHRVQERRLRTSGRELDPRSQLPSPLPELVGLAFDLSAFDRLAPDCIEDWRTEVERAKAGRWRFLGVDWPGGPLDDVWHLDPVTGEKWEDDRYCFDVPYRHRTDRGDVKYVWEVNRLQILPVAAALWRAEGDPAVRDFVIEILDSWITANPPYRGINWNSGIELALRMVNILAAVSLLGPVSFPRPMAERITQTLAYHLFWLARYPSKFSSANNHLIAELAAIYVTGRTMPGLPNATRLADEAWRELCDEILKQIHDDGIGAEQSPTYTSFTLEWVLLALATATTSHDTLPAPCADRLVAAAKALRWFMDKAGNVPRIGDDDEGRVLLSGAAREPDYVPLILSSLCASLDCPQFAPPVARAHLRQTWLGRTSEKATELSGVQHFDSGGYSVMRTQLAGCETVLIMDHGPLGYLSIAAHGHADALAIWWHLDGKPVLVDAGTYLYHSGGELRNQFRGTGVHNTLTVNDLDQSLVSGAFNWSHKAKAWRVTDSPDLKAEHDGYAKRLRMNHSRAVKQEENGFFVIDHLIPKGRPSGNTASLRWILAPDLTASIEALGKIIVKREGVPVFRLFAEIEGAAEGDQNLRVSICPKPFSDAFGQMQSTQAIQIEAPTRVLLRRKVRTSFTVL